MIDNHLLRSQTSAKYLGVTVGPTASRDQLKKIFQDADTSDVLYLEIKKLTKKKRLHIYCKTEDIYVLCFYNQLVILIELWTVKCRYDTLSYSFSSCSL